MPASPERLKEQLDTMVGWTLIDHRHTSGGKTTLIFVTPEGDRKEVDILADEEGNSYGTLMTDGFVFPSEVIDTGVLERGGQFHDDLPYFELKSQNNGETSRVHPISDPEANGPGWMSIA